MISYKDIYIATVELTDLGFKVCGGREEKNRLKQALFETQTCYVRSICGAEVELRARRYEWEVFKVTRP